MPQRPNILFLMADQMQERVLAPGHPCLTPNLDRLAARGMRFPRAYTPNAICSPARASLMTGLLPHNHGVLTVTHTVDDDQCNLRTDRPHWAQRLHASGYRTGYFGKWHVERSSELERFGWQVNGESGRELWKDKARELKGEKPPAASYCLRYDLDRPAGYHGSIFYGVTDQPPERRGMGVSTAAALDFLDGSLGKDAPWCCFVSVTEPHDPYICGEEAFAKYDVQKLDLAPNVHDDLAGRPNIYKKAARVWAHLTDRQRREAMACYYASITEIDAQFGRLLDKLETSGQAENTIVVMTSDHGDLLGAHGLYCKNFTGAEEVYTIPMLLAGPGVARGKSSSARVGLHELGPTLLELAHDKPLPEAPDRRSFAPVLRDPARHERDFEQGYAEYFGGRMILTQRVVWDGKWKLVFNGFDFDELYDLEADPYELRNLAEDPAHRETLKRMFKLMWRKVRDTGDRTLLQSQYPILRVASFGPDVLKD
ncbi:MAG: sulfatase-like hydrolase/transferase [Planctomycetota bacterium]|nr:sulfatase-like hydrolase/transferase [Planctomycetota bacterium]